MNSPLEPGTPVSILPEFRDDTTDAYGWRVVEDRGDRVVIEAPQLLRGAVHSPQTVVGREMLAVIPAPASVRELTEETDLRQYAIERADYFDGVRFYLATWPDRSGWYCTDADGAGFLVTVGNISETFNTAREAENALWALVEITG